MSQRQRDALVRMVRHFTLPQAGESEATDDPEGREDQDGGENDGAIKKRKRSGAAGKKPRHPWAPFMRLQGVALPPAVGKHLEKKGTDAVTFLSDHKSLMHKIDQFGSEAIADAFVACYKYTVDLETRQTTDHFRWCFSMLMYFDLVRLIRPHGSGKVGPLMLQDIENVLGPVLEELGIDKKQALEQIRQWSQTCKGS